jgi:hypothetical protein
MPAYADVKCKFDLPLGRVLQCCSQWRVTVHIEKREKSQNVGDTL